MEPFIPRSQVWVPAGVCEVIHLGLQRTNIQRLGLRPGEKRQLVELKWSKGNMDSLKYFGQTVHEHVVEVYSTEATSCFTSHLVLFLAHFSSDKVNRM